MKTSEINWKIVETIAGAVFPDEYETTTHRQRENMEIRISEGLPPVIPDISAGGMHQHFVAALENMGMILTALSIIVTWYTWNNPKPQRIDYQEFLKQLKGDSEFMKFFTETVSNEVNRIVENKFTSILEKIEELYNNMEE